MWPIPKVISKVLACTIKEEEKLGPYEDAMIQKTLYDRSLENIALGRPRGVIEEANRPAIAKGGVIFGLAMIILRRLRITGRYGYWVWSLADPHKYAKLNCTLKGFRGEFFLRVPNLTVFYDQVSLFLALDLQEPPFVLQ